MPITTLDEITRELPESQRPNIVKIDVEGAELSVLRGARELLTRDHPTVFVELHGVAQTIEALAFFYNIQYAVDFLEEQSGNHALIRAVYQPQRFTDPTTAFPNSQQAIENLASRAAAAVRDLSEDAHALRQLKGGMGISNLAAATQELTAAQHRANPKSCRARNQVDPPARRDHPRTSPAHRCFPSRASGAARATPAQAHQTASPAHHRKPVVTLAIESSHTPLHPTMPAAILRTAASQHRTQTP